MDSNNVIKSVAQRPATLVSQDSIKSTGTAATSTSQSRAPSPLPPNVETGNRSTPSSSPIKLYIHYKINYIADINVLTSSFMCDIKVFYKWFDPYLVGRKKDSSIDFKEKGVFNPDVTIQNAFEITETSSTAKLVDSSTGEVKLTGHTRTILLPSLLTYLLTYLFTVCYKGTFFITAMPLQLFPFDCQNLQLTFRPHKLR